MIHARALVWMLLLAGCDRVFGLAGRDAPIAPDSNLPVGLIRWYTMDGLEDRRLVDATGEGREGLCTPLACPTPAGGVVDGALRFDGMTQLIRASSDVALEGPGPFTIAVWTYAERTTNFGCVVSKLFGAGFSNSWQLCRDANRQWGFGTRFEELLVPEPTPNGGWHHVAIRWDGMTKTISVDGFDKAEGAGTITYDGGALVIGADVDGGAPMGFFPGVIDDLRIYDRVLSAVELIELASLPARRVDHPETTVRLSAEDRTAGAP